MNGRALVISLDDGLPQAETTASGHSAIKAARLPLYPVTKVLEDVLREHSEIQDMHLNLEGKLFIASDDGGLSRISEQAASLAAIVGADVRFASYLREQLVAAKCGDQLSLLLENAVNATSMSCSKIWAQPDCKLVVAHAICGVDVAADDFLVSGVMWDAVRRTGIFHAIGGPQLSVTLPLYILWVLTEARARGRMVIRALFNMTKRVEGQLSWQAWELVCANLGVLENARNRCCVPVYPCLCQESTVSRAADFGDALDAAQVHVAAAGWHSWH